MRILVFTQYFPPEVGATQTRLHTFASGLAARGHDVTVVCEVPNHPHGIVHPEFRGRWRVARKVDGMDVRYVWVWPSTEKGARQLVSFYASYMLMACVVGAAQRAPDVVFASSPPLTVGVPGALCAWRYRVPFVLDVRDLWPAFPAAIGQLRDPRAYRAVEMLEEWLYRRASAITTVTVPFRDAIARKVARGGRVELLPNGTSQFWLDTVQVQVERAALDLPRGEFIWTFAGNLGRGQAIETAIEAAHLLGAGYRLVIVGAGAARPELESLSAKLGGNVSFYDQVPAPEARRYLAASDALLVSLRASPALAGFVPSKLYDFCATGRPVVVAAAGEAARLANEASAAVCVPPGSPSSLADAISALRSTPELASSLGEAGRDFAVRNLRERQVDRLDTLFEHVVSAAPQS